MKKERNWYLLSLIKNNFFWRGMGKTKCIDDKMSIAIIHKLTGSLE